MKAFKILALLVLAAGCGGQYPQSDVAQAISEVASRENRFADYPQADTTYLSFSRAHGFQVNYLGQSGKAWLWYPGNTRGVAEEYKLDVVQGQRAICWRHPANSYNPVTRSKGGSFRCESLSLSQRTIIAALPQDPFALKTGQVPYTLKRCTAPSRFQFDRRRYSC